MINVPIVVVVCVSSIRPTMHVIDLMASTHYVELKTLNRHSTMEIEMQTYAIRTLRRLYGILLSMRIIT